MAIMNESGWTDMTLGNSVAEAVKQWRAQATDPQVQSAMQDIANAPAVDRVRRLIEERSRQQADTLMEEYNAAADALVSTTRENGASEESCERLSSILKNPPDDAADARRQFTEAYQFILTEIGSERQDKLDTLYKRVDELKWRNEVRNQTWEEAAIDEKLAPPTDRHSASEKLKEEDKQEQDRPDGSSSATNEGLNDGNSIWDDAQHRTAADDDQSSADLTEDVLDWWATFSDSEKKDTDAGNGTVAGNSTLNEYLKKTKDSSQLSAANAADLDYNILSELAYVRKYYDNSIFRITCEKEGLTVAEYCEALLNAAPGDALDRYEREFLDLLKNNNRYKNLVIDHAEGVTVGNVDTQVIAVSDGNGHGFFAIQGTNGTTLDWINDGKFALPHPTEEEEYINKIVQRYADEYGTFDICGHSQGGRDAVTAAAFLSEEQKKKLRWVYSQDGPGYTDEFMANYGDQFADIEDKVRNVCPEDAYVSGIFTLVGKVVFVKHQAEIPNNHDHRNWLVMSLLDKDGNPILDENGNQIYVFQNGRETEFTRIVRNLTKYAEQILSPEAISEVLPLVFRLLSDPENPAYLDFEEDNILSNLENLSPGDTITALAFVGVIVFDVAAAFIDKYEPYLAVAGYMLDFAHWIPGLQQPFVNLASMIVKFRDSIEFACKVISKLLSKCLEYKAQKMQAQRAKYIGGNPLLHMDYDALKRAAAYLEDAKKALRDAAKSEQTMMECFFQKRISSPIEELIGDVLKQIWEVTTERVLLARAINWVAKKAGTCADLVADAKLLATCAYISKGLDTIDIITRKSIELSESAELGANAEGTYTVTPSALSGYAADAGEKVQTIISNITTASASVNSTDSIWQADDYDSIKTLSDKSIENILVALDRIAKNYEKVGDLASAYSALQSAAVQEFQAAAN